jgi:hypothetical protein
MEPKEAAVNIRVELDKRSWLRFPPRTGTKPARLFHYTSHSGLLGIVSSNVLWATNALYLNDSSELSYGLSMARAHLNAIENQSSLVEQFLRRGADLLDLDVLVPGRQFYACCFCENPDILSQWRAYADRGGGYAIGFDMEDLGRAGGKRHLSLFPVDYGAGRNEELLAHDIKALCEALVHCAQQSPANDDVLISAACEDLKLAFIFRLFWLKHPGFAEEKEWRILANFDSTDVTRIKFRQGQTTLVPYVELEPSEFGDAMEQLPIREVVHGPTAHPQLAAQALHALFKKHGFNAPRIWGSTMPLRTP